MHNHNGDDDSDGRSGCHNSDDDIPAGTVQVIYLRGRGEGQTQCHDHNCTPGIFWGMGLLNVTWDCLPLRGARMDFQW
ncbi:MAG TPA: hypothetical protein VMU26_29290 [Candidatus Polarisedimenticolia bacterium]|nr:hypothetical protein [Candidatus Polarisedimenticolia bacterium]